MAQPISARFRVGLAAKAGLLLSLGAVWSALEPGATYTLVLARRSRVLVAAPRRVG